MGLTATVSTLDSWLGVLILEAVESLGCVAGEQKWVTGVRSRGDTCLSSWPEPSASQFAKIRRGPDTHPHHQELTVLWWKPGQISPPESYFSQEKEK